MPSPGSKITVAESPISRRLAELQVLSHRYSFYVVPLQWPLKFV